MRKYFEWYDRFRKAPTAYTPTRKSNFLNVKHWKVISSGLKTFDGGGHAQGLFIMVDNKTYFCPNLKMRDFFDFLHSDLEVIEQFFTFSYSHDLPLCYKCMGNGKFDWVNRLTKIRKATYQRDKNVIYEYVDRKKGLDFYTDLLLSKTELNGGDLICLECKGTGVVLDARFKLLNGFPGIKMRIKERSMRDMHKIIITKDEKLRGG